MAHTARAESGNTTPRRYQSTTILTEFVAVAGYHEKLAIRVWNGQPATKHRETRVRASLPILTAALRRNAHLKLNIGPIDFNNP
jgi:catechol-2,3-dioxygenase